MALAELKNGPSFLLIQVFSPPQEKKHHLPHWESLAPLHAFFLPAGSRRIR
jgi:hypothetical protein